MNPEHVFILIGFACVRMRYGPLRVVEREITAVDCTSEVDILGVHEVALVE